MKYYEEEKRGRELMEEVCKELAHKIAEDKAIVETLKMESINIREQVEEERKMLQIAEAWCEERVHMKMADAKLALDDKYCQMNKFIADLEAFLRSRGGTLDVGELRKAELFRQVAKSINIKDLKELFCMSPKPSDIYSPENDVSKIQTGSFGSENQCSSQHLLNHSNDSIPNTSKFEEAREWEWDAEEKVSSYSLEGSARKCKENVRNDSPNKQITGFRSAEKSLQKISSTFKLWDHQVSSPSNSRHNEITFGDGLFSKRWEAK
ncbi:hypothetical protein P3X46_033433 [Hevea brasiliensis]|uniref:GTD-binding domain-containing protein n=1 Tax=Hevea brasiliensis TaxID=3981 RepID=A0ABQ9KGG3_HEVBR|nr:hypothetical protein P3X46_033433 [Hevea brasiliensis]